MSRSTTVVLLILASIVAAAPAPAAQNGGRAVLTRSRRVAPQPQSQPRGERIFVASATSFLPASEVAKKLRKKDGFARLGLEIASDPNDADFIVEVDRAVLSRFTFVLLDAKTHALVGRGQVSSLFGTASSRIADRVLKILSDRATTP